jgi:hypothetical protein
MQAFENLGGSIPTPVIHEEESKRAPWGRLGHRSQALIHGLGGFLFVEGGDHDGDRANRGVVDRWNPRDSAL